MWQNTVTPNLDAVDTAGYCLRMQQKVWGAPARYATAWDSWQANPDKHADYELPNIPITIWFDHWGTYGGQYGRYGHVATHVPGRGILSNPGRGIGQKWYNTIEECERDCNAKYVGWTTSINGLTIATFSNEPLPEEKKRVGAFYRNNKTGAIYYQEKPGAKLFAMTEFIEWSAYAANGNKYADMGAVDIEKMIKLYGLSNAK